MKYIMLVIILLSSGCGTPGYFYGKAGLGHNSSPRYSETKWIDQGGIGGRLGFGYRHRWVGNLYGDLNWTHHSQPAIGYPFNEMGETASEHTYYDLEYRWR